MRDPNLTAGQDSSVDFCCKLQVQLNNMEADMQKRIDAAVAESELRFRGQKEASEKNVHFSARVVALNSRMQNLQKQLKESQNREKALMLELDEARELATAAEQQPPSSPPLTPNGKELSRELQSKAKGRCSSQR